MLSKVERFRKGFWGKESLNRPLVGVVPDRVWSPILFLRRPFEKEYLVESDVNSALVKTEYEDSFASRRVMTDDWIPYSAAWRGVPWLEAMCGCRVRYSSGSMAPEPYVASAAEFAEIDLPANSEWMERLRERTEALAASASDDCWISTTILRGSADVLAAMRGLSSFCLDLRDEPEALSNAAARINELHARILDTHFGIVQPKHGGYGHIFGYWAPGPTTVLQSDVMGLCAPALYRDLFMPHDAELVRRLGSHVLFHLHSTGLRHYRHVLDIPGIAGLEINIEANGPAPTALLPVLSEVLERSRLILMVDGHFEETVAILRQLPKRGLYVVVSDKFVPDQSAFEAFLRSSCQRSGGGHFKSE
jgi:hypothetical protein